MSLTTRDDTRYDSPPTSGVGQDRTNSPSTTTNKNTPWGPLRSAYRTRSQTRWYRSVRDGGERVVLPTPATGHSITGHSITGHSITGHVVAQEVARALRDPATTVRALILPHHRMGDLGTTYLAMALVSAAGNTSTSSQQQVTELLLSYNRMGRGGAVAIGRALASNPPLLTICLSNNTIRDEGAIAIANGLKSNSTLTWLGLAFNEIGDEGATALATALKSSNSTVTVLILMGNRIGDGGAAAMATQLSTSSLKRLDLDENCIGEDGFAAMGSLMNSNRTLRVRGLAVQRR